MEGMGEREGGAGVLFEKGDHCSLIIQFLVEGKRPLRDDPCKRIMLDAFDLGVLGELGASRFPGPKRVRAKDAKDAKVRKAITELSLDHPGWRACGWRGFPGSVSPATTEAAGGVASRLVGDKGPVGDKVPVPLSAAVSLYLQPKMPRTQTMIEGTKLC